MRYFSVRRELLSGKEALAYQFKKSNRAILIGTNTEGAFSVGRGIFNKKELPYFLYLATGELLLDQNRIEGIGIPPDIYVPYPLTENNAEDPQLKEAKLEIVKRIKAALALIHKAAKSPALGTDIRNTYEKKNG